MRGRQDREARIRSFAAAAPTHRNQDERDQGQTSVELSDVVRSKVENRGSTLLASCGKERIEKLVTKTKVAGKLKIACSWVFGNVGKAMLKPLFARQHCGLNQPVSLSSSLQFALTDLLNLLPEIPLKPSEVRAFVLYAGVYVNISGSRCAAKQVDSRRSSARRAGR